jgi:hypothetical protein
LLAQSEAGSWPEIRATSSTAEKKGASFTFDGVLKPVIFFTDCNDAARICLIGNRRLEVE